MASLELGLLVVSLCLQGLMLGFILIQGRAIRQLFEQLGELLGEVHADIVERADSIVPDGDFNPLQALLAQWLAGKFEESTINRDGAGQFAPIEIEQV